MNSRIHWVSIYVRLAGFAGICALLTRRCSKQSFRFPQHLTMSPPRTATATIRFHFCPEASLQL